MNLKRLNLSLPAALLLLAATSSAHAQTWDTIWECPTPDLGAWTASGANRVLMIAPATAANTYPDLLVTGRIPASSAALHRLEQSADPAGSVLLPLDGAGNTLFSLASADGTALYSAGQCALSASQTGWLVRRSLDGGVTWDPVRTWTLGGSTAQARGAMVTANGTVVVCGFAFDAAGCSHWIIETSSDQGSSWTRRDLFKSTKAAVLSTGEYMVQALGVTEAPGPNGGLFVVGSRGSASSGLWTVLRSRDGGATWQIKDSWQLSNRGSSRARKAAVDAQGRIFVLGDTGSWEESWVSPWVVRMSSDGGESWKTIFGPWKDGVHPVPWDLTVDAAGRVWIAGEVLREYAVSKRSSTYACTATVVSLSEDASGVWTPTVYPVSPECPGNARYAMATSIAGDAWGRVYVNGTYKDSSTGAQTWFIRRLVP